MLIPLFFFAVPCGGATMGDSLIPGRGSVLSQIKRGAPGCAGSLRWEAASTGPQHIGRVGR